MKTSLNKWLILPVLVMTGCATTPEQSDTPTIQVPENWSSTHTQIGPPQAWVKDFNSPQLESLINEALMANANLERVAAVVDQSIAEGRIAGADRLPSTNLGLNGSRQSINSFGPSSTGGVIFEDFDLSLSLNWELDVWGRVRDLNSAAITRVEASEADFQAARLSLAAQVTKAWFNLIEAQVQVAEARSTAKAYEENLKTLESRFRRGLSQGLEIRQIRSLASSSQADVATRERALDLAVRSLELLLGRYPSAALSTEEATLPKLPKTIPPGLPIELLQRRPDLIAAERRLTAADKDLRAKRKDLLPKISLTASAGTSSSQFEDLLDGDFSVWSLAGNLTQPIFQGGRILANVDRSLSLIDQARASYRDTALQAFLEVENALTSESYLLSEYAALKSATNELNAAEELAWNRFSNGTTDFLNVLETKRSAANSRARLISAQNALLQNRVDLYLALGGPFEEAP